MPQAIAVAATWVATNVQALFWAGGTTTLGAGTLGTIYAVAYYGTTAALTVGLTYGSALLAMPDIPKPEVGKVNFKQNVPPRRAGYGRARISGYYMLWEASADAFDVVALHDGKIGGFVSFYLNDDPVTLGYLGDPHRVTPMEGDKYGGEGVFIDWREGLAVETSYSPAFDFSRLGGDVWTAAHRGDGIASGFLLCKAASAEHFPNRYPNGVPMLSAVADLGLVCDWRDEAQSISDPATWQTSYNPVVNLAHYLCFAPHGPNYSWETRIAPRLAEWTAAANVCDEAVALKAGGTEARYRVGGFYNYDNAPSDVIGLLLSSFDGWMAEGGDGALIVRAGKYTAPTLTLDETEGHILGFQFRRFTPDNEAVNELRITFTSPAHDYTEVETDPWRDEVDIAARGAIRTEQLPLTWVQSNGQARRLAKRRMSRMAAGVRGTVTTTLIGLEALGERYVRLKIPTVSTLANIVVEVESVEIDLMNLSCTITWTAADPNIDAWNPSTEEGDGPVQPDRAEPMVIDPPTINSVTPYVVGGTRLSVALVDIGRPDLTPATRWRVDGDVSWVELTHPGAGASGGFVTVDTGFVPASETIEVQAKWIAAGGSSAWSSTTEVET